MCTAIIGFEPGALVLLAGIRDELADRPWLPPARHWPRYPDLTGGKDLQAGGTWLAVAPRRRRVACVLNAPGRMADPARRRSRGSLPLAAAAGGATEQPDLSGFDPFHLITGDLERVTVTSWDGTRLSERELGPGTHLLVNHGLGADLMASKVAAAQQGRGLTAELARIRRFGPAFGNARRPVPGDGPPADAWGEWFPLVNGDGLATDDPAALIVRRELPDGRIWGSTSVSLVALAPDRVRYDFTATPGDAGSWYRVAGLEAGKEAAI